MKQIIIITALLILATSFGLSAQSNVTIQSKDTIQSKYIYCRMMCGAEMARTGVDVWIDYGRKEIRNEDKVHFVSIIEAVNHMADEGWDLLTIYPVSTLTYCLMRKPRNYDKAPL